MKVVFATPTASPRAPDRSGQAACAGVAAALVHWQHVEGSIMGSMPWRSRGRIIMTFWVFPHTAHLWWGCHHPFQVPSLSRVHSTWLHAQSACMVRLTHKHHLVSTCCHGALRQAAGAGWRQPADERSFAELS